jgi:hypothetical protein
MRNYMASTVMKIIYYVLLHHHPSMFLLSHLKHRLLRLLSFSLQQWRHHGLRGRSSLSRELSLTFKSRIYLNRS